MSPAASRTRRSAVRRTRCLAEVRIPGSRTLWHRCRRWQDDAAYCWQHAAMLQAFAVEAEGVVLRWREQQARGAA